MAAPVLFIHGAGGDEAYEADGRLVESLRRELGSGFDVRYPQMPRGGYEPWKERIAAELSQISGPVAIVGHSHGGSVLLKYLTEERVDGSFSGLFLVAPPFWGAPDWEIEEFVLERDFASALPRDLPIHFYFSRDDETVEFSHLELYRERIPSATFHAVDEGGHQFGDDLASVAADLKTCLRAE